MASAGGALVPVPGVSTALKAFVIKKELNFYKRQLGLPDENSKDFTLSLQYIKDKIKEFVNTSKEELVEEVATSAGTAASEELLKFLAVVGPLVAGGISFISTYKYLNDRLSKFEKAAVEYFDEILKIRHN